MKIENIQIKEYDVENFKNDVDIVIQMQCNDINALLGKFGEEINENERIKLLNNALTNLKKMYVDNEEYKNYSNYLENRYYLQHYILKTKEFLGL